jgi:hypothetical protein
VVMCVLHMSWLERQDKVAYQEIQKKKTKQ